MFVEEHPLGWNSHWKRPKVPGDGVVKPAGAPSTARKDVCFFAKDFTRVRRVRVGTHAQKRIRGKIQDMAMKAEGADPIGLYRRPAARASRKASRHLAGYFPMCSAAKRQIAFRRDPAESPSSMGRAAGGDVYSPGG